MWSRSILVPFYLGVSLSFFLFLDFIAISDCVFNNKNNCVLGHTGYQIIITILVISTLNANLRVATRVYDVEGGAIFSKNSTFVFFDGAAWTPRLRSPSPIMAPGVRNCSLRMWSLVRGQWTCHVVVFVDITLGDRITLTQRNTDTAFLCMVFGLFALRQGIWF